MKSLFLLKEEVDGTNRVWDQELSLLRELYPLHGHVQFPLQEPVTGIHASKCRLPNILETRDGFDETKSIIPFDAKDWFALCPIVAQ